MDVKARQRVILCRDLVDKSEGEIAEGLSSEDVVASHVITTLVCRGRGRTPAVVLTGGKPGSLMKFLFVTRSVVFARLFHVLCPVVNARRVVMV